MRMYDDFVLEVRVGGVTADTGYTYRFGTLERVYSYLNAVYEGIAAPVMAELRQRQCAVACRPNSKIEILFLLRKEHVEYTVVRNKVKHLRVFTYDDEVVLWQEDGRVQRPW